MPPAPGERMAAYEATIAELARAKAAADAANEAKSRFLASVSHEIRSPLNSIYGYAQLLERGNGRDAAQAARIIRRSSEHLTNLVEGLLDISQIESGLLRLNRDVIRFPALVAQMADMFEPQAAAKRLEFRVERASSLPEFVRGDQKRLRQVLINLLSNAIKFTDRGSVVLTVGYRNEMATFDVTDTGIGIAPGDIERIFEPFERAGDPAARRKDGAGLGLSITRALVQIMGGQMRVASEAGCGSHFTVRLMLSQPLSQPADAAPADVVTGYAGPRRSILIVDDDPAQRAMLRDLLAPLGFETLLAGDGDEAIAFATQAPPDLVLLDISIPGKSGWETAEILRQQHGAALRIIMLSANVHQYCAGGDGLAVNNMFLMKPFEFHALLDILSGQLNLEWTGPDHQAAPPALVGTPAPLPPGARSYLKEIERLVRIGHVRAIETQIDALANRHPDLSDLVMDMRTCLDAFDLEALAALARRQ